MNSFTGSPRLSVTTWWAAAVKTPAREQTSATTRIVHEERDDRAEVAELVLELLPGTAGRWRG